MTMAMLMVLSMNITSFAAGWQKNSTGWWYGTNADNTTWHANGWQWLDGNNDGVAECYYFDGNGYMLANTKTPDGYMVDGNGAWVVNGAVQTKAAAGTGTTNTAVANGNYDPAHPLANVVDTWNLRLVNQASAGKSITLYPIGTWNVHALLTNQMDKYVAHTPGVSTNPITGSQMYITEEDYNKSVEIEQTLYNWFCNWLNGMDFQNMSEMDKAKEIQKIMHQAHYDLAAGGGGTYGILINKVGYCDDFANAGVSLAKALGLKAIVSGNYGHEIYYIVVDGEIYMGSNDSLNLNNPTKAVYDQWITVDYIASRQYKI